MIKNKIKKLIICIIILGLLFLIKCTNCFGEVNGSYINYWTNRTDKFTRGLNLNESIDAAINN